MDELISRQRRQLSITMKWFNFQYCHTVVISNECSREDKYFIKRDHFDDVLFSRFGL
jgi:hypothetical protein